MLDTNAILKNKAPVSDHTTKPLDRPIVSALETITPDLALKMLNANHENQRTLSIRTVKKYANDMRLGLWMGQNGETIKLSDTGKVLDGQHRLKAVIESGQTIECIVVRGVFEDDISTIDAGKKRTFGDTMKMNDLNMSGVTNNNMAAIISYLHSLASICNRKEGIDNKTAAFETRWTIQTNCTLQRFANNNPFIFEAADEFTDLFSGTRIRRCVPVSRAITFWILFKGINREAAYSVLMTLENGYPFQNEYADKNAAFLVYKGIHAMKAKDQRILRSDYIDIMAWAFDCLAAGEAKAKFLGLSGCRGWQFREGRAQTFKEQFRI